MAGYIDSGDGSKTEYVGHWLDQNLISGIKGFRAQFGYFRFGALKPFGHILKKAGKSGSPVHLVLGSNAGSLAARDLQLARRIVEGPNTSLTVVAFGGAEFHPKTVHVVRANGSRFGIVGSSNLTESGLGLNVEASIILDTQDGDGASALNRIARCVERWSGLSGDGVFHINSDADIQALVDAKIINLPQPRRGGKPNTSRGKSGTNLGRRNRGWSAGSRGTTPSVPSLTPRPTYLKTAVASGVTRGKASHRGSGAHTVRQWCKKLAKTDAQQVSGKTNPTGKLRLTQSRFDIDHTKWFRSNLLGAATWKNETRQGNVYHVAMARFDVTVRSRSLGRKTLMVDHAVHRISGQRNVSTTLAWGHELSGMLAGSSHVGDWVVITRDASGRFSLVIQKRKPMWAP